MDTGSPDKRLRQRMAAATKRLRKIRGDLKAKRGPPESGDLFLDPTRTKSSLSWAFIQFNPDNPRQLFVVPADDHPLAGVSDVVIPKDAACGPLTLRCGCGLWVEGEHFPPESRVGWIDEPYLLAAKRILASMVRGSLEGSPACLENEADPEYEHWMEEVAAAREALERWLAESGCILRLSDFRDRGPAIVTPSGHQRHAALAAASDGLLGRVVAYFEESDQTQRKFHGVTGNWMGGLIFQANAAGLTLLWQATRSPSDEALGDLRSGVSTKSTGKGDPRSEVSAGSETRAKQGTETQAEQGSVVRNTEPPAVRVRGARRRWRRVRWRQEAPGQNWTTATFPWQDKQVAVRVGIDPGQMFIVQQ